jgi:hypothetical protein
MAMFKIEKKIPVPSMTRNGTRKYPFREMAPGDSFLVTSPPDFAVIRASAYAAGKSLGSRFITRKEKDGIRVWRAK